MSTPHRPGRPFTLDALRVLEDRLMEYGGPEDDPEKRPGYDQAAVSVILRQRPEPELLLVKRAASESDPWSGHMALPGGRRDPTDPSLLHTAIRETREETGIVLDPTHNRLGRLQVVAPHSRRIPQVDISPFVFALPPEVKAKVNCSEIAEIFWVPVSHLLAPETRGVLRLPMGDAHLRYPAFEVEGEMVWGLTYRILLLLLESVPD